MLTHNIQNFVRISETFSTGIARLTWWKFIFIFGIWHESVFAELRKLQSIAKNWGDLLLLLFIEASCDPALRCNVFLSEFVFSLSWAFYIHDIQFVLQCFLYIYISYLFVVCHTFSLRCSLAFVILPVSPPLVFMPLFSEVCLFFCSSLPQ